MIPFDAVIVHLWPYRRACLAYGWTPSFAGLAAYIEQRESGQRALWEHSPERSNHHDEKSAL